MVISKNIIKKIKEQLENSILNSDKKDYSYIISPPVIKFNGIEPYLATFMIFVDPNQSTDGTETISAERPTRYDIFDIETGEILVENMQTKEYEFSNAPYNKQLKIYFTDEQINEDMEAIETQIYKRLDILRAEAIQGLVITKKEYDEYLSYAQKLLPVEYQRFLVDLSNLLDYENINEDNEDDHDNQEDNENDEIEKSSESESASTSTSTESTTEQTVKMKSDIKNKDIDDVNSNDIAPAPAPEPEKKYVSGCEDNNVRIISNSNGINNDNDALAVDLDKDNKNLEIINKKIDDIVDTFERKMNILINETRKELMNIVKKQN